MRTEEFKASLPHSPFIQHFANVHMAMRHIASASRTGQPIDQAVEVAEHSLREIARFTCAADWLRDGIRREVLDEFMTALKMVTAEDPTRRIK